MMITGDAKTIASAFVAARGEMSATVAKDAKGNFGKYMTLAALVEATAAAFANHGLAIVQEAGADETGVTVATWLIHESGATMQLGTLTMPLGDRKPQTVGSALTYGRRYALAAVCGIAPDDDDGQAAQDSTIGNPLGAKTTQKAATPRERPTDGQSHQSPPHQRLWGQGMAVFGSDWDMARPWLIAKWTAKVSPANTRNSASDLSDDEKDMLADYLKESVSALQKVWPKQKASMLQSNGAAA